MALETDTDVVDSLIQRCNDASARTRSVGVVIVSAVLVVFAAFLLSRDGNWMQGRAALWERVYDAGILRAATVKDGKVILPDRIVLANLTKQDQEILEGRHILLRNQAEAWLTETEKLRVAAPQVQMPILGTRFDFNDFGIIGGLGLVGLAAFLFRCANRERATITSTFNFAKQIGRLVPVYRLMEAGQVLHVPPRLPIRVSDDGSHDSFGREPRIQFPHIVMFMPMAILTLVFGFDLRTSGIGGLLGGDLYKNIVIISEIVTLLMLIGIAWSTYLVQQELCRVWKAAHSEAIEELSG